MPILKGQSVYQCDICNELKWKSDGLLIMKGKHFWESWHEHGWDHGKIVICADCRKVIKNMVAPSLPPTSGSIATK